MTQDVILHDEAVAPGNGATFPIGDATTLTLSVSGTSTGRHLRFEVAGLDGGYTPVTGVNLNTFLPDNQTTGTNEKWQFEVAGLVSFRARLEKVNGGSVSVKGRAVV